jgi:hypothetical protein
MKKILDTPGCEPFEINQEEESTNISPREKIASKWIPTLIATAITLFVGAKVLEAVGGKFNATSEGIKFDAQIPTFILFSILIIPAILIYFIINAFRK